MYSLASVIVGYCVRVLTLTKINKRYDALQSVTEKKRKKERKKERKKVTKERNKEIKKKRKKES